MGDINQFPIIRSCYNGLTKSEKRIARYIMDYADCIMKQTISEIATNSGTSEVTVSRFCKKLGYSGLQSFKISLASKLSMEHNFISEHDNQDKVAVTEKIFKSIVDGLSDTLKVIDYEAMNLAANKIIAANKILVYGFGNSANVCKDIATRYLRFGFSITAYSDAHQQVTSAVLATSKDVVIAVSHTGTTLDLLDNVRIAKAKGACIIAITSYAKSDLAREADIVLVGMGREIHYQSEAMASRLIHLAITDSLYACIAMNIPDRYRDNIQQMRRVIAEKHM